MSEEIKLAANEYIKTRSDYLRGTLAEELSDLSTGAITEDSQQLIKFHGSYMQDDRDMRPTRRKHKLDKAYSFMIRIRVPGGVSTSAQWIEMDRLADTYGNQDFKLTTRQAYQLHGIIKSNLKQTIKDINSVAMDTIAACGDVNRNVMCTPNPYLSEVHATSLKISQDISDHLTPQTGAYHEIWLDGEKVESSKEEVEPIYGKTYLPRKFKIAVAVPPHNDVDIYANDLSFIAIEKDGKCIGFNVAVGGGMGTTHGDVKTFPRAADIIGFCTVEQAVDVAEKVVLVQRDFGCRTERKHARLKYTVEDYGADWFRAKTEEYLGYKLEDEKPYEFTSNGDTYGWMKDDSGNYHFCFFIEGGRVIDTPNYQLKTGLLEIAKAHADIEFRLTANQNVLISNIDEAKKAQIQTLIDQYKLEDGSTHTALRRSAIACVALPTCALALAESERYLPGLIDKFDPILKRLGLEDESITIRMTGCPNGCGRPFLGEIAFVGRGPDKYNVYLGAGHDGQRLNKLYREAVPGDDIIPLIEPLLEDYAAEKEEGEHFGDFVIRKNYIAATLRGADFHDNIAPEAFAK